MIRLIQVGVGGFGWSWTDIVLNNKQVQLTALVDINEEILNRALTERGLPKEMGFTNLAEAIEKKPADAVLLVTPPATHKELANIALEAGLNVLCEKPLADNMDDAKQMAELAEKMGKILMVSQNYRFSRQARTAKRAVDELEGLSYVQISFHKAPHFGGFREKMPYPLLIDMSIHHFDLLRFLTSSNPQRVQAFSWRPKWSWFEGDPCLMMFIEMDRDIKAGYFGSWVSGGAETPWDGVWRLQGYETAILWNEMGILRAKGEQIIPIEPLPMPIEGRDLVLETFREAVEKGEQPECNARDNLWSLAMVFSALESIKSGKPVAIADYLR
ncbi:Gfo/Idh/MocA family oxidoreductase [bacterium]|nr:Gfo/Idh/MocA family oxidoreductase [bacterium]